MTNEQLQRIGQAAVDYFADIGECLFCDVDHLRTDADGSPPVHDDECPLREAVS